MQGTYMCISASENQIVLPFPLQQVIGKGALEVVVKVY